MAARRLTARQLAKSLAEFDQRIAALDTVLATYAATFAEDVPEPVYDAWNAALAARDALAYEREQVERNPYVPSAGEQDTWELVKQNID